MKKFTLILGLVLLGFINSCTNDETQLEETQVIENSDQTKALTVAEVNAQITKMFEEEGSFNWSDASDHLLWSASVHGENILTIGYGNEGENFRTEKSQRLTSVKDEIIQTIKTTSIDLKKSKEDIVIYDDETLNYIDVTGTDLITVKELRKNN